MEKYVSFEISKKLSDIGFNEPCHRAWVECLEERKAYETAGPVNNQLLKQESIIKYAAPNLAQVQTWLRQTHDIHIVPHFVVTAGKYEPVVYTKNSDGTYGKAVMPTFTDYDGAIEAWMDSIILALTMHESTNGCSC